jgi:hypothetical protein
MTNTRRNTIVLSALLVLLAGGSYSLFRNLNKKTVALKEENTKTEKKISVLEAQISNIDSLRWEYEMRKALTAEQSKVMLDSDNPTTTYRYLLRMLGWMDRNVIFDFAMSDKGKKETTWNEYVLSGRSNYQNVVELTKNIEHQRAVITVEELAIGADGVANSDTVSFSLVLRTHFNEGGLGIDEIKPKTKLPSKFFYQLFRSRVFSQPLDYEDVDPTLVRAEQCILIGITENQIFLRDSQGVIKILNLKDKVAYGYLDVIDAKQTKAVFKLFKYGVPEEFTLYLTNKK